jgi:hypothetical protein
MTAGTDMERGAALPCVETNDEAGGCETICSMTGRHVGRYFFDLMAACKMRSRQQPEQSTHNCAQEDFETGTARIYEG